jgi:hypothetical protein
MAAILLELSLSAEKPTRSISIFSKANSNKRYLQCLLRPVP